jgi:uncharacterized SAM-binding protein YcdF (DUF218 family)
MTYRKQNIQHLNNQKSGLMKTKTVTSIGALHPILFFAVMYVVVLFFSIFICSSLFYSCKSTSTKVAVKKTFPAQKQALPVQVSTAVVLR